MRKFFTLFIVLYTVSIIPVQSQINTNRVLDIGRNALYFEDYVLSIQYFNQVIKAKPYLAEPYLYRAIAKFNLEDYKGAESDITLCLERNPFYVYAYQCRGAARQNLGNFKGAIEDYEKGLEYQPEDKNMLINRGIAYIQLKDYQQAETALDLALKYHPKLTQAYLARGSMYAEKGDTIKAIADYNASINLDKYYAPAYGQRALLYYQQDKFDLSLADFNEAIRLEPKQIGYYINRGLVRYHLNDLRGAMSDYDAVVVMNPQNIIARFNRGLLRSQVGDVKRAVEDFNVVIKEEPDNFMAIYNRAILQEESGDYKNAVADLDVVLEEYPNFVPGYYFRSEVKRKLKDAKGADQDYWYAFDLEQKLRKAKEQGKTITGKNVLDPGQETAQVDDKTRESSDKNIEKFNRLVVYDKVEEEKSKYKNEIRGRVQDKQVKVDLEPQFVISYYERIEALENLPRTSKILSDYNRKRHLKLYLKLINNEAPLTDDQADFHFRSINDYSLAINNDTMNVDAYFGRAMDFMVLQDLSEAIADFDRVIALDPTFLMAYFNRAVVRFKQMEINNYSSQNDNASDFSLNIQTGSSKKKTVAGASSYTKQPAFDDSQVSKENKHMFEYESVMRDYDAVIKLDPDFVYAYFNRANLRCAQKDFRLALTDYNEAIRRNPNFAEAYFNRGLTQLSLGDTEHGISDLSKAGELGIVSAYSIIKKMSVD